MLSPGQYQDPRPTATGQVGLAAISPGFDVRRAIGLTVTALLVYAVFLLEDRGDPSFWHPIIDAEEYHRDASHLAAGYEPRPGAFWHPPLYPYLLAGIYYLSSGSMVAAKIIHALMGVASCLLTWSIGRRLFNERAALLASVLLIFWGPMVFLTTQLLPAGLTVLLNLILLRILIGTLTRPSVRRWLSVGLILGLSAINIPNSLILLPALVLWLILTALRQRNRRMALCAIACVVGTIIPIAPVTVRNYLISGEFVPIAINGGINFYIGNNPDSWDTVAIRPGHKWEQFRRQVEVQGITSAKAADRYFWDKSFAYIRQQPGHFLRNLAYKTGLFFNAREIPRNVDVYFFRQYSALLSALAWRWGPVCYPFGLAAPLAALGLVIAWRMNRTSAVLVVYLVLYSASVILFFVSSRYRLPVIPVVTLLAGCGATWLWDQIRRWAVRSIAWGAAVIAPVAVAVNWPMPAPTDNVNFAAEFQLYLGVRALYYEAYDIAEKQLRRAVELDPTRTDTQLGLGDLLTKRRQLEEAATRYRLALEFSPQCPEAWQGLGQVAIHQERWADAADYLARALADWPTNHDARHLRAVALSQLGKLEQAVEEWQTALRLGDTDPRHRRGLAHALVQLNLIDEAELQARRLLESDAQDAEGHLHMGLVLGTRGQWSAALPELRQAVELDETNVLYRLELARALHETGQSDQAHQALAKALELAESKGDTTLAAQCQARMQLYQSRPAATEASSGPAP